MLEIKNLSFNVDGDQNNQKEILKDVSLKVDDQRTVVITGPNGSGKSTLAKLIMGLEKPSSGQILFDGQDITSLDITERANRGIGFAFQQPVRFKGLVVHDLLNFAAKRKISDEEACECLSSVGLCSKGYIERELNESLSGGEMKRIEIAMLMLKDSKLYLFDEPEAGIDLWSFQNLIKIFVRLREKTKASLIIISHQERILEIADEIIVVDDGRISAFGPKKEILPGLMCNVDACMYERNQWNHE